MIDISRSKTRNEDLARPFLDSKFYRITSTVQAIVWKESKILVRDNNPFAIDLERRMKQFQQEVEYYGMPTIKETGLDASYRQLRRHINHPATIKEFQAVLVGKYMLDVYPDSPLQESLVQMYKSCSDMVTLLEQDDARPQSTATSAEYLLNRLQAYEKRLGSSLQRGPTSVLRSNIFVVLRHLWGMIWCGNPSFSNPLAPIQTETLGITRAVRRLSIHYRNNILRRGVQDFDDIYRAIHASEVVSMIFGTFIS